MNAKLFCILIVIALVHTGSCLAEPSFEALEQSAMNEVAESINQDLLDGHSIEEHLGENPAALLELVAEAGVETAAAAESEREAGPYDHFFDDEEEEERPRRRRHTKKPSNSTLDAKTQPSIAKNTQASPAVKNETAASLSSAKAIAKAKTAQANNSVSWEDRRRYSYTDADFDAVDSLANKEVDVDPEEELQRLLSDPEIEFYSSDKDKGVYFGPTKADERRRFLGLRKAIRDSRKQARSMRKLVKRQRAAAKALPGANVTAAVKAAAAPAGKF